jgi:NTE family protein
MTQVNGKSYGMILSGGGAYAAYEVGVMKALFNGQSAATGYATMDPDVVAGTSAGALNASLLLSAPIESSSAAIEYLEDVWLNTVADAPGRCGSGVMRFRGNPLPFIHAACFTPNPISPFLDLAEDGAFLAQDFLRRGVQFLTSPVDIDQRALELVDVAAFVATSPLLRLLHNTVRLDKIRSSRKKLRVAVTNWRTGALKVFANEDMNDENGYKVILASSSIPGVFPRVEIENDPYVDGGLVMNTPLKLAIDAGAESLHIIYMDPDTVRVPLPRLPNTANDMYRSLIIGFGATLKRDLELARRVNQAVAGSQPGTASEHGSEPGDGREIPPGSLTYGVDGNPHRRLSMHLYHPFGSLDGGWLSFDRHHLQQSIERGVKDAIDHDCRVNQCILVQ